MLRFCNAFDMSVVKRFYVVRNSQKEPCRGWIMHRRETKWFYPLRGVTRIWVADADGIESGSRMTYRLDSDMPQVLCIPPSHWFLIEQDGQSDVQIFSDCFVNEFENDTYRRNP